jgi:hypothetical protein
MHKPFILKSMCFGLFVQSLFFQPALFADSLLGLYFSPVSVTENGYLVLGVEIAKSSQGHSFLAQELRYHKTKGWEEVLYTGKAELNEKGITLHPDSCQLRANRNFGEKKGLVRRFDCLHLSFELEKGEGKARLSASLLGTVAPISLEVWLPEISGEPVALSFLLPDQNAREEGVWGFHLNGIGTHNPIQVWDKNGKKWKAFHAFESLPTSSEYNIYRWKRTFSD